MIRLSLIYKTTENLGQIPNQAKSVGQPQECRQLLKFKLSPQVKHFGDKKIFEYDLCPERRVFAFLPWLPGSPELNLEEKEVILDYPMYTASLHWGPEIQSFLSARDYSNKSL